MNFLAVLSLSVKGLSRAPYRAGLSALGVTVGVAALLTTVSIGKGAQKRIEEALARPEARTLQLLAVTPRSAVLGNELPLRPRDRLQIEDYRAIRDLLAGTGVVSPKIFIAQIKFQAAGYQREVMMEGIDVTGFAAAGRAVIAGGLFTRRDVESAASVCVLSESLFRLISDVGTALPITVRVGDLPFTCTGIVSDAGAMFRGGEDLHVYVPYTSLRRRLSRDEDMTLSVQATDMRSIGIVREAVMDAMEARRAGRRGQFVIAAVSDSISVFADGSKEIARLLAAVGGISLIVGGIGIMNITLYGVHDRIREIGIRMAVGTRRNSILAQVVTEAVLLTTTGGAVGIAVGLVVATTINRLNTWPADLTVSSGVFAVVISILIGLVASYGPARRAASMDPVDALRAGQ